MDNKLEKRSIVDLWSEISGDQTPASNEIYDRSSSEITGKTGFFRHAAFQERFFLNLRDMKSKGLKKPFRILVVPGSVGAEAYTYAALAHELGLADYVEIDTLDISPVFTEIARRGIYPKHFSCPRIEDHLVETHAEGFFEVSQKLKKYVRVLPACDIVDFQTDQLYDAVIALTFFRHISINQPGLVKTLVNKLCGLSSNLILANDIALPPHTLIHFVEGIEMPINFFSANGFRPLGRNWKQVQDPDSFTAYPLMTDEVMTLSKPVSAI